MKDDSELTVEGTPGVRSCYYSKGLYLADVSISVAKGLVAVRAVFANQLPSEASDPIQKPRKQRDLRHNLAGKFNTSSFICTVSH